MKYTYTWVYFAGQWSSSARGLCRRSTTSICKTLLFGWDSRRYSCWFQVLWSSFNFYLKFLFVCRWQIRNIERILSIIDVRANRFKPINENRSKGDLVYALYSLTGGNERKSSKFFAIDHFTGVVALKQAVDYDDNSQPKLHKLLG